MNFSRQYLEFINQNIRPNPLAELILKHGAEFQERAPARWRGTPKACYANAQHLVRRRKGLRYVEGYACNMIPCEHAWCIDAQGRVIDPTWDDDVKPDYFGVTFDFELVRRVRKIARPSYSVLFTWWKWREIYPLLISNLAKDVRR